MLTQEDLCNMVFGNIYFSPHKVIECFKFGQFVFTFSKICLSKLVISVISLYYKCSLILEKVFTAPNLKMSGKKTRRSLKSEHRIDKRTFLNPENDSYRMDGGNGPLL